VPIPAKKEPDPEERPPGDVVNKKNKKIKK
jgi:hypothetical protein